MVAFLDGNTVGRGLATSPGGKSVGYQIIEARKSIAGLGAMALEARRWHQTALLYRDLVRSGKAPRELQDRAVFADDVLVLAAENTRLGVCCQLVAQAEDGRILGVLIYFMIGRTEATFAQVVIDPLELAGSPGGDQLRGIGTSLVAAAAQRLADQGVEALYLHPLDKEAHKFWAGRGFVTCGQGGLLCLRGTQNIMRLIDGCAVEPDSGSSGHVVLCGKREARVSVGPISAGIRWKTP